MANASVEKLKALGLRHGEKAVVGLAAVLCLVFLFMAATQPTIDLTPEQVKQAADSADVRTSNRTQSARTSSSGSRRRGSRTPSFEAMVEPGEEPAGRRRLQAAPALGRRPSRGRA